MTERRIFSIRRDVVVSLAGLAERRDGHTGNHLRRVRAYCEVLSLELGMTRRETVEMGIAALAHDVGKLTIPSAILAKTAPLTAVEYRIVKRHTIDGSWIIPADEAFGTARTVSRSHHERWDGKGYPDGLAGEDIPLCARIAAVADVFDALVSARPYKPAWPIEKAMREVLDLAGAAFDSAVTAAWERLGERGAVERIVRTWPPPSAVPACAQWDTLELWGDSGCSRCLDRAFCGQAGEEAP
ncbi:MAG: HD-GYP domain-containing protein [Candidatus Nitrospinota bacterium M3_3B_026]